MGKIIDMINNEFPLLGFPLTNLIDYRIDPTLNYRY